MPNNHPVFRAGEHVKFASLETLEELQAQFGSDGPEGRKWIHDLLAADMMEHADTDVRIKEVSIYHGGIILYEFDEVEGCWLEASIVDPDFEAPSDHDIYEPAHQFYEITTDAELGGPGVVQIQGIQDQVVYCTLRKAAAGREAKSIIEVSKLRTKGNFEARYGFDGHYDQPDSDPP